MADLPCSPRARPAPSYSSCPLPRAAPGKVAFPPEHFSRAAFFKRATRVPTAGPVIAGTCDAAVLGSTRALGSRCEVQRERLELVPPPPLPAAAALRYFPRSRPDVVRRTATCSRRQRHPDWSMPTIPSAALWPSRCTWMDSRFSKRRRAEALEEVAIAPVLLAAVDRFRGRPVHQKRSAATTCPRLLSRARPCARLASMMSPG